jgi:Tfp pilus assembly pilus retraction ATPase PilT
MVTLDSFLLDRYQQGMIAREEVITKAQDPTTVQQKLQEMEQAQSGSGSDTAKA